MLLYNSLDPVTFGDRKDSALLYADAPSRLREAFLNLEKGLDLLNEPVIGEKAALWEKAERLTRLLQENSGELLEISAALTPDHLHSLYDNFLYSAQQLMHCLEAEDLCGARWIYESQIAPLYLIFYDAARYLAFVMPSREQMELRNQNQMALCDKLLAQPKLPVDENRETDVELSILVVGYNHSDLTKYCVESIQKYTTLPYELILIDNGSSDDTWEFYQSLDNVKIIRLKNNVGLLFAIHLAVTSGVMKGRFWAYLNNDAFVTKDWDKILLDCIRSDPRIAIAMPVTDNHAPCFTIEVPFKTVPMLKKLHIHSTQEQYLQARKENIEKMRQFAANYNRIDTTKRNDLTITYPFASIMRPSARLNFNMVDDPFYFYNTFYYSDTDGAMRMAYSGYRQVLSGDCFIHHEDGATLGGHTPERIKKLHQGDQLMFDKYRIFSIDAEEYDKYILDMIDPPETEEVRVLYVEPRFCNELAGVKSTLLAKGAKKIYIDAIYTDKAYKKITDIKADRAIYAVDAAQAAEKLKNPQYDLIVMGISFINQPHLNIWMQVLGRMLKDGGFLLTKLMNRNNVDILRMLVDADKSILDRSKFRYGYLVDYDELKNMMTKNHLYYETVLRIILSDDTIESTFHQNLKKALDNLPANRQKNRDYLQTAYWVIKAMKK